MASVVKRVKTVCQPEGGYLPISCFTYKKHTNSKDTFIHESIGEALTLSAVECLLNIHFSSNPEDNFVALESALLDTSHAEKQEIIAKFYSGICSENPITAAKYAVKLARFEAFYKFGIYPKNLEPDRRCLESIFNFSESCKEFFKDSVRLCAFDFEGGYSRIVNSGNGGYMTKDSLWNITVSEVPATEYDTLLILVQYLMGLRSYKGRLFGKLRRLGIYNPLLCEEYTLNVSDIPKNIIEEVSRTVLGYDEY